MKTCFSRQHWEECLKKDSQDWIISHSIWRHFWNDLVPDTIVFKSEFHTPILFEDPLGRGFIFVKSDSQRNNVEIYFAYTDSQHRRKGISKKLLEQVEKHFRGKTLFLDCEERNRKIWEKMGFEFQLKEESHLCNGWYIYSKSV